VINNLFYIAIILISGIFVLNFLKAVKKRRRISDEVSSSSAPNVEILYTTEIGNNKIHFVSGSLSVLITLSDCIYIPIEVNKTLEIRTFYNELKGLINERMEKEVLYYYDTSMKNKIFLSEQKGKKIIYSIIPFSYEISEIEEPIKNNYFNVFKKCLEIKCETILIPIKPTDRIGISPQMYAHNVIEPIFSGLRIAGNTEIYLFHENERLLWNIINALK
jgi:hypothetical protein